MRSSAAAALGCSSSSRSLLQLGAALAAGTCALDRLDLKRQGIGPAGTVALVEGLKAARMPLSKLSMDGNQIGSEGAAALTAAIGAGQVEGCPAHLLECRVANAIRAAAGLLPPDHIASLDYIAD